MKEFPKYQECIKCGGESLEASYSTRYIPRGAQDETVDDEFIQWKCTRCTFRWESKTKDAINSDLAPLSKEEK